MSSSPSIIKGNIFSDHRGALRYNNDFDLVNVRRMYVIQNANEHDWRGWKAHQVEQRWFAAISGAFEIQVVPFQSFFNYTQRKELPEYSRFTLHAGTLDVLHCPKGYATAIKAIEEKSKLLVLADFLLGETEDEHRFDMDFFTK